MNQIALYLASGSPRRRELLAQIGVRFAVLPTDVDESRAIHEPLEAYVQRLALEKARAGWAQIDQHAAPRPVLGADTIGIIDDQLLQKPRDQAHAAQMLRLMSGREHRVITAVAMTEGKTEQVELSETRVCFRTLTEAEIAAYWQTGEPQDKAGGYAIQGLGTVFVREIHGSYSNVVGLPLEATVALLAAYNVPWWQTLP